MPLALNDDGSDFSFSLLTDIIDLLQLDIYFDTLYEEFTVIREIIPPLRKMSEKNVSEKWQEAFKTDKIPNLKILLQYLFSIPVSNAATERTFSLMGNAWRNDRNRCSPELIRAELQTKINFQLS